jgi:hypothetical protein
MPGRLYLEALNVARKRNNWPELRLFEARSGQDDNRSLCELLLTPRRADSDWFTLVFW